MTDPQTADEWQLAVNAAKWLIAIDSCRQYGLIEGGPVGKIERCDEILSRGCQLGYVPAPIDDLIEMFIYGKNKRD